MLNFLRGFRTPTLEDAIERYLQEVSPTKRSAVRSERSIMRAWLNTPLAGKRIASIKATEIVQLRDEWLKTLKSATVVRRIALFSHLYTIARTEWGFEWLSNPIQSIRKPKIRNARERRVLTCSGIPGCTDDEIDWIVRHTRSKVLHDVVRLAIETAMRRAEIAHLLWEFVYFDQGILHLPDTKNGHPRNVPLSPAALSVLKGLDSRGFDRVFKVSPSTITRSFRRSLIRARCSYIAECGDLDIAPDKDFLVGLRFHDLRHEAISRMAPHFQVHELAAITGHRDTRMLMRYYHPDARDFAKRLAMI